jgi:baseplate J-like protein
MPINLPNLDDRTFADLVEEAQALIPVYEPRWTNHNASDPGITLVELFAYLTEMLMYRLNRVTDANRCAFLKLIDGIERIPSTSDRGMVCRIEGDENATSDKARSIYVSLRNLSSPTCEDFVSLTKAADPQLTVTEVSLNDEVRNVVLNLREQDRAVTCADFERLSLAADPQAQVKRAHCVPQRDLTKANPSDRTKKADADMSVVIVPGDDDLIAMVSNYLEPRRLLAARVHVVAPRFVTVAVHASLTLKADAVPTDVDTEVWERLTELFSPLGDGQDYEGWPFGRDVYVSEIYQLLDRTPGVDFVTRVEGLEILTAPDDTTGERLIPPSPGAGELVAIKLYPDELASLSLDKSDIVLVSPVDKETTKDAKS